MLTISTGSKAHTYISQFIDTHDLGERFSYGPPQIYACVYKTIKWLHISGNTYGVT